jgi:uncharacterized protein YqjF (DUF2071 family)
MSLPLLGDFNRAILRETAHRPWPMPDAPWLMTQTWHDLLFAHWRVDAGALRARVPRCFELDTFGGQAWLGVVPFWMDNVAPRFTPSVPGVSRFPELNVRTYVRADDKAGIYFFSLDAGSSLAVAAARLLLRLPYFSASMRVRRRRDGWVYYRSRRPARRGAAPEFVARYRAVGPPRPPSPGTLEHFLAERYCLFALDHGDRPYRLDIHHPPWPLQPAEGVIERNTMAEAACVTLPDEPPLLHFAARQDMVAWAPRRLAM